MSLLTLLSDSTSPHEFIRDAARATTSTAVESLLSRLPITPEDQYAYDAEFPENGWQTNRFHWIPVGRDRGNAGRIKQANHPVNPIAERVVNGMEALIEMARQRELVKDPSAFPPSSPRDAVMRYFGLPALDQLPKLDDSGESKCVRTNARGMARQLRVRMVFDKVAREFTVAIEDDGNRATTCLGASHAFVTWFHYEGRQVVSDRGIRTRWIICICRQQLFMADIATCARSSGHRGRWARMDRDSSHISEEPSR